MIPTPAPEPQDNMNEYERVNYARRRGGGGLASSPAPAAGEEAMMINEATIPNELKQFPNWVTWRAEERNGKPTKVPYTPGTGRLASTTDPTTWGTFADALADYELRQADGVGYVFTNSPFAGIDLDHCLEDGKLPEDSQAAPIVKVLDSYTEVSPSGEGLHILVRAELPPGRRRKAWEDGRGIEMYDTGRFFTMTGDQWPWSPDEINERTAQLEFIHAALFSNGEKQPTPHARPSQPVGLSDHEMLEKAMQSAKFRRLWEGNCEGYPSQSEADLAMCSLLAFWCGGDRARMDKLFRQSGLYREKWERADYRAQTISRALEGLTEFYTPPEHEVPKTFRLTDGGDAERLVARYGQDLHFCYPWGQWFVWTGSRWSKDDSGQVEQWAKSIVLEMYTQAAATLDDDKRKALAKHAASADSGYRRKAMMYMAQSEPGLPVLPDEMDADHWLLNCTNGTLNLLTGELQSHLRENLITRQVPIAYDPDAGCPLWDVFLDRIMGSNQGLIGFLKRAVGYCLTGDTSEQCLFILYGTGMNGKSTFLEVITALLGDYGQRTPTEGLLVKRFDTIPNDIAALKGARLVTAVESEEGRRLAESLIKAMTGGDRIPARFLHHEWFDFLPTHKVWLGTNHKPIIRGTDYAIWRRIRLIPFSVVIPEGEQDKHLAGKLKEELPGILRWAVQGCLEWQRDGLGVPGEVRRATDFYRAEMDVMSGFLDDCCILSDEASVRAGELYKAYLAWCETNGEKAITRTGFGRSISERGYDKVKDRQGWYYLGIGLLEGTMPD